MILFKKIILFLLLFAFVLYAAPKDDFANVLNLAKFSSCEDIAYKFDTLSNFDGFGKLIEKELQKKTENLFPWRFDVTNGYKEGFFYYALLGYANELSGDIPYAYQCYRNATLYIDEEKSFNNPEPTAEIYLGLGRTCLAAGRYMDAKDWLDVAYDYANNNPKIMASVDRVAIQKGNELGDYENIILHYQHLMSIANDIKSPPFKGDLGGCKLTKPELANYAQILFYSRKDREGFSKLLEGISNLGIDNNLGVKDLLIDKFLNNIMRADNEEVEYFYDLLGYEIEAARAKAGDEKYLAFLCNARTLFCKVYDFLSPKDDLKKVKKRIDKVKEQLNQGYDVFGQKKYSVSGNQYSVGKKKKNAKSENRKLSKTGKIEEIPEVELENLLMLADWYFKLKKYVIAKVMYDKADWLATGTFANIQYDGTTTQNAAKIGSISSELQLNSKLKTCTSTRRMTVYNPKFELNDSFRSAELTLQLYQKATNDEQRIKHDTEWAIEILPKAHCATLTYLQGNARKNIRERNFEIAIRHYQQYKERRRKIDYYDIKLWINASCASGDIKMAFTTVLQLLKTNGDCVARLDIFGDCMKIWSVGEEKELLAFSNIALKSLLLYYLTYINHPINYAAREMRNFINWKEIEYENHIKIMKEMTAENYYAALNILTNVFTHSNQVEHNYWKAICYTKIGNTNLAFRFAMDAHKIRCELSSCVGGDKACYPTLETSLIESLLIGLDNNYIEEYRKWIVNRINKCILNNNISDATKAQQMLGNNLFTIKNNNRNNKYENPKKK